MGYQFNSDFEIEKPFFNEMVHKFQGRKAPNLNISDLKATGYPIYRIQCPCCKKKKAVFGGSKRKNTFVVLCPVDGCGNRGCKTLHQIIQLYGNAKQWADWREARWSTTYTDNWFGVKSQTEQTKGESKTFKEKQQLKSETARIYSANSRN